MATYTIQQVDLSNARQVQTFLSLPFHIYRYIPQWVPPLQMEAARLLDARKNPFYAHSKAVFFLALEDGLRPVKSQGCLLIYLDSTAIGCGRGCVHLGFISFNRVASIRDAKRIGTGQVRSFSS